MKKAQIDKLGKALKTYFKEIHKIYVAGGFREESFYSSLKALVEERSLFRGYFKGSMGISNWRLSGNGEISEG